MEQYTPYWFKDKLICWYDIPKQNCTNNDMMIKPILKDFSDNHLDLNCYNFAWSEMSGIGNRNPKFTTISLKAQDKQIIYSEPVLYKQAKHLTWGYKLIVDGLDNNSYISIFDSIDGAAHTNNIYNINYNGTHYIPDSIAENIDKGDTLNNILVFCKTPIDITIKMIPIYKDALLFDGVDDFCINKQLPLLNNYTVIAVRKLINSKGTTATKLTSGYNKNGIFWFETNDHTWSTCFDTPIKLADEFSYQTNHKYNGVDINNDNVWLRPQDTDTLILGCKNIHELEEFSNMDLWLLLVFNDELSESEINEVRYMMSNKYNEFI